MNKFNLLILFCFTLILAACSQSEEDIYDYSGLISHGKTLGYEYTITKEQNTFSWKVGYKGDISAFEESAANKDDLENFMAAVSESKVVLAKLIISVSYFLIVMISTLILYKKNRKMLKGGGQIITVLASIAIYIAFEASFDLIGSLQDTKHYYLILFN